MLIKLKIEGRNIECEDKRLTFIASKKSMKALRKIRLIALIVMPALLWVGFNNASNWHFHKLKYGIVTTHSHVYNKSANSENPAGDHHHEKWELIILNQIFDALLVFFTLIVLATFINQSFRKIRIKSGRPERSISYENLLPVRGPPSVLF